MIVAPEGMELELERLRAIEKAAHDVSLAAWTDRWSRLHGHPAIAKMDAALQPSQPIER